MLKYKVGGIYYTGIGAEKNFEKAFHWMQKAAKQNVAAAQYELGGMYFKGQGTKKNIETAIFWTTKAAEQNFAPCSI